MDFSEIAVRMKKLGVDRAWLAEQCRYSRSHIANALAPKGNKSSKTQSSFTRFFEALDREEQRQAAGSGAGPEFHQLVLRADDARLSAWNRAALADGCILTDWATVTLDSAAGHEPG